MNRTKARPPDPAPAGARPRPCYRELAGYLVRRLPPGSPPERLPPAREIARRYRIPLATAQFVRRAAVTRLRPPVQLLPDDPGCPPWVGVAADLRTRIETGQLTGRLPGRKPLAATYRVGACTVRKALDLLAHERLVEIRPGTQGTYIVEDALPGAPIVRPEPGTNGSP
ncbi:GntR family transcriptional regulator [Kitasatospora sp. NPDC059827]|uniref:GntR family transcriptional regulator n=1 Tax=Kitasatospora sp. NPDC059827 TaxID=3346964 RepID=UPI0036581A24